MKEAANALRWCVAEMERRYRLMANLGVRNIAGYNKKVKDARAEGEPLLDPLWKPDEYLANDEQERPELDTLPFIVVVIDEFADMMIDRKSTRLNSSHVRISYAVFCLKKKS